MASGFGELTQQANALVAAGDLVGARNLLGPPLDAADPSPGLASAELAEAAGLQARVLVTLGDPHAARGWAAFAYSATTRLYGAADPRTVAAAATLAAVLHRVGSHARAARLYRDVIIELTATDGPESLRVLAAHADLATVEYAQGECALARNRLEDAWELHREVYGDGHPGGLRMLARLGSMERNCGLFTRAHEHLALARELCRENLPADHPLAAQVAALARAAADPDHVCADPGPEPEEDPHGPAGRRGAPDYAEPWRPEPRHAEPEPYGEHPEHTGYGSYAHRPPHGEDPQSGGPRHAAPSYPDPAPSYPHTMPSPSAVPPQPGGPAAPYPTPPEQRPGHHDRPYQGGSAGFPDGGEHPPDAELPPRDELPPLRFPPRVPPRPTGAGTDTPQVPPPRLPPAPLVEPPPRWATPPPAGSAVPPAGSVANRSGNGFGTGTGLADDPDGDGWWPPDVARRTPDGEDDPVTERYSEAGRYSAPAAAEPWQLEGRSGATPVAEREPPDGQSDDLAGTGGVPEVRHLPARRSSRLPVRVHRPSPAGRRLPTAVVAGLVVLVVVLGTAAVVLGFGLTGEDEPAPPAPGPATSAPAAPPSTPPPASPGTPPGSVTLADNRTSVTLEWTYPTGATGPVVLAGGRAGQELRPFQELPAGSTGYVVYGLQTEGNFCFSVAVVYSESVVGEADPVCTERPGRSPSAR